MRINRSDFTSDEEYFLAESEERRTWECDQKEEQAEGEGMAIIPKLIVRVDCENVHAFTTRLESAVMTLNAVRGVVGSGTPACRLWNELHGLVECIKAVIATSATGKGEG